MRRALDPFRFLLIAVTGWMNQHQLLVIDYLRERIAFCENNPADDDGGDRHDHHPETLEHLQEYRRPAMWGSRRLSGGVWSRWKARPRARLPAPPNIDQQSTLILKML